VKDTFSPIATTLKILSGVKNDKKICEDRKIGQVDHRESIFAAFHFFCPLFFCARLPVMNAWRWCFLCHRVVVALSESIFESCSLKLRLHSLVSVRPRSKTKPRFGHSQPPHHRANSPGKAEPLLKTMHPESHRRAKRLPFVCANHSCADLPNVSKVPIVSKTKYPRRQRLVHTPAFFAKSRNCRRETRDLQWINFACGPNEIGRSC